MVGADFETLCAQLFSFFSGTIGYLANEVGYVVAAGAVVMALMKAVVVFWRHGHDQAVAFVRGQAAHVVLAVALAVPWPLLGGRSFMAWYPQAVIAAGWKTASAVVGAVPEWGGKLSELPYNLHHRINEARNELERRSAELLDSLGGSEFANKGLSFWDFIKAIGSGGVVEAVMRVLVGMLTSALVVLPLVVVLLPVNPAVAVSVGLAVAGVLGAWLSGASTAEGLEYLCEVSRALMRPIATTFFVNVLTFCYFGVLLSTVIKAVIYAVTFPISLIGVVFESRRHTLMESVWRGVCIALTPVVAGLVFGVACQFFVLATVEGGIVEKMMLTWVGSYGPELSFGEKVAYMFRVLVAPLFMGGLMVVPAARYVLQSSRIAAEVVGGAIGWASGLSEELARRSPRLGVTGGMF